MAAFTSVFFSSPATVSVVVTVMPELSSVIEICLPFSFSEMLRLVLPRALPCALLVVLPYWLDDVSAAAAVQAMAVDRHRPKLSTLQRFCMF